jgi:hypothetical protein
VDAPSRATAMQVNAKKGKPFTAAGVLTGAYQPGAPRFPLLPLRGTDEGQRHGGGLQRTAALI